MRPLKYKYTILISLLIILASSYVLYQDSQQPIPSNYIDFREHIYNETIQEVNINFLSYGEWRVTFQTKTSPQMYEVFIPRNLASQTLNLLLEKKIPFMTKHEEFANRKYDRIFSYSLNLIMVIILLVLTKNLASALFTKQGKTIEKSKVKFTDIGGLTEVIEDVSSITELLKRPREFHQIGGKPPKGIIFYGPPGTGKTLIAKAVAGEAGVPFIYSSASEFVEKFVGVGASRIRSLYKTARKHAPCVVFIDEIDAIGGERGKSTSNSERDQTINQLLTALDGFEGNEGVLTIVATNRLELLDTALTRSGRFDRKVHIPYPRLDSRVDIIDRILARRNIETDQNFDARVMAARTGRMSGADLENLINTALEFVHKQGEKVLSFEAIEQALDFILLGRKTPLKLSPKENQIIALHESGHTLSAYYISKRCREQIYCTSIIPHEGALGRLIRISEEENLTTIQQVFHELVITLGGRAAEFIDCGQSLERVSIGAADDLQKATLLAHRLVTEYGYGKQDKQLQRVYAKMGEPQVLGEAGKLQEISSETREYIEELKDEILTKAWGATIELLTAHQKELRKLSQYLLTHKKIYADELKVLIEH